MPIPAPSRRYRFGIFELDAATGELRRKGLRIKLHAQPCQVLCLLLDHPGEMLTREQISRALWPEGTFVDYEHGVNSAINRLREALGDKAANPRFIETLARRGYRFVAPVERLTGDPAPETAALEPGMPTAPTGADLPPALPTSEPKAAFLDRVLAQPEDLPHTSHRLVEALFLALQLMYLGFYIGALANLPEINDLFSALPYATQTFAVLIATAATLIPVRTFLLCAVVFRAPGAQRKFRTIWPMLLPLDILWALAPFLLLHHISEGFALACTTLLVYSPFAQRSLVLMGAGTSQPATSQPGLIN